MPDYDHKTAILQSLRPYRVRKGRTCKATGCRTVINPIRRFCDPCGVTNQATKKLERIERLRLRRIRKRDAILHALPPDWEDMFRDALCQVLFEHGVTLSQVVGRQRASRMTTHEPYAVPTIKNLAPRLWLHGIMLSEVLLRAEQLWTEAQR